MPICISPPFQVLWVGNPCIPLPGVFSESQGPSTLTVTTQQAGMLRDSCFLPALTWNGIWKLVDKYPALLPLMWDHCTPVNQFPRWIKSQLLVVITCSLILLSVAFSSLSHFLNVLLVFPGATFQINYLHLTSCLDSSSGDIQMKASFNSDV